MFEETQFRIQKNIYSDTFDILIIRKIGSRIYVAKPLDFEEKEDGIAKEPTIKLSAKDTTFFNSFFEHSKHYNFIPQEQVTNQEKDAIKYHLEDMRNLVFKIKK